MIKYVKPIHPKTIYLFSKSVDNLEDQLEKIEKELDVVYKTELQSNKYSLITYHFKLREYDIEGGIVLSIKEGRIYSLPNFQEKYKRLFQNVLETENDSESVSIDIKVIGYADQITENKD